MIPQTLREKAAQLVVVRIGSNMPPGLLVEDDAVRISALLERCPLGGLVLFNGQGPSTADVLSTLQQQSRFPLLIATDMERGVGQQVRGATVFPHAMAYAALGEEAEAAVEDSARIAAREALACGLHITFSPVADVNSDPRNPIIATRAFGTEPGIASRLGRAYIQGCKAEGLLTTAKHFPGHGNTHTDSHEAMPVVESPRDELDRIDLAPFRAAVAAGVDLIMTAHVAYPALDPQKVPATLSRPILKDLLRGEMGYEGVVVTDSLLMGAVNESHPDPGKQAVALIQAGVDLLLDVPDPEATVDGIIAGVTEGRLDEADVDAAFQRVWRLKEKLIKRFGPSFFVDPSGVAPRAGVGSAAHLAQAASVARKAITVEEKRAGLVPVTAEEVATDGMLAVLVKPNKVYNDPTQAPLKEALLKVFPQVQFEEVGPEANESTFNQLLARARSVRHVVVAMVVKPAAWHRFGLLPAQHRFVETMITQQPVVLVSLGVPNILEAFPEAAVRCCTYSDVAPAQQALVDFLAGTPD